MLVRVLIFINYQQGFIIIGGITAIGMQNRQNIDKGEVIVIKSSVRLHALKSI